MLAIGAALMPIARADAAPAQLSLVLPSLAQITGLWDVTFSNPTLAIDAVSAQNVCTWTNTPLRTYTVTASGSGAGAAFTLSNPAGKTVPYSVGWAGSANAGTTTALSAQVASGSFSTAALAPTCSTGPNASSTLTITIPVASLQTMVGGTTYTGALTLLIAPV